VVLRYASGQIDKQTDTLIAILLAPTWSEVKTNTVLSSDWSSF